MPFMWDCFNLSIFASLVAPFGGFFASGINCPTFLCLALLESPFSRSFTSWLHSPNFALPTAHLIVYFISTITQPCLVSCSLYTFFASGVSSPTLVQSFALICRFCFRCAFASQMLQKSLLLFIFHILLFGPCPRSNFVSLDISLTTLDISLTKFFSIAMSAIKFRSLTVSFTGFFLSQRLESTFVFWPFPLRNSSSHRILYQSFWPISVIKFLFRNSSRRFFVVTNSLTKGL